MLLVAQVTILQSIPIQIQITTTIQKHCTSSGALKVQPKDGSQALYREMLQALAEDVMAEEEERAETDHSSIGSIDSADSMGAAASSCSKNTHETGGHGLQVQSGMQSSCSTISLPEVVAQPGYLPVLLFLTRSDGAYLM